MRNALRSPTVLRCLCAVLWVMVHDTSNMMQISNLSSFSAVSFGVRWAERSQYVWPPFRNNWRQPGVRGTGDRKRTSSGPCRCGNLHHGPTSKRKLSCPSWFKFKSTFRASATYGTQLEHCVNVQCLRSGLRTCICIWRSRKDPINLYFLIRPVDTRNKKLVYNVYLQFSRNLHTPQKAVIGRKTRKKGSDRHIPTARRFMIFSCIQANKQANVYFQQPLKLYI